MIYLAGPYWHESEEVRNSRIIALAAFHAHLVDQTPRSFFYNPLANSQGCTAPESYWREHGKHLVGLSQAVYVLCLDGWMESTGVRGEVNAASKAGLNVTYFEPNTYKELNI